MTQRLTPELEARARRLDWHEAPMPQTIARALLREIDALRAELAGAEERGAARERVAIGEWLYDVFAHAAAKYHMAREAVRDAAEAIERGDHVRTGTTPPDAGE